MEELKPEEINDLNERMDNINSVISEYENMKGMTTREQDVKYENLLIERSLINGKIMADQAAKFAKQEIKSGTNASDLPTQDEYDKTVKRSFFSNLFANKKPTPKESAAKLAEEPKVEGLFNRFMKRIVGEGTKGVEKTTGVKSTIAVKKALVDNGSNINNVNNDNVRPAIGTITSDADFQVQMRKAESSLGKKIGTYFISNLPIFMILGVAIATMVLIDEGKVSPAAAAQAAAQQLSGCYMIYGDGKDYNYVKLDGCSDWYSESTDNLLKCRCNNADSDTSKPSDCTGDNSDSPYCIGKIDTSGGKKICINPNDKNAPSSALLKCQGEVGQNETFIRYTSHIEDGLGIITNMISMLDSKKEKNKYNPAKNVTEKFGIIEKIAIIIGIIVILLILGITIYNVFGKKNKK